MPAFLGRCLRCISPRAREASSPAISTVKRTGPRAVSITTAAWGIPERLGSAEARATVIVNRPIERWLRLIRWCAPMFAFVAKLARLGFAFLPVHGQSANFHEQSCYLRVRECGDGCPVLDAEGLHEQRRL